MDPDTISHVLGELGEDVVREGGVWHLHRGGVRMSLIVDTRFDRLRVIAPIVIADHMSSEERAAVLEANFHTALDARYATCGGILYAAFMHPLSPLTASQLRSAVSQVAMLVRTFGTTYSSGAVVFAPDRHRGPLH